MSQHTVSMTVNGVPIEREVPARRLLGDFLRDDLGLYGTKLSCGMQVCGTCTVLVDGQPTSSCTYLAVDVDGRDVTTIEGVAEGDVLSPVQRAFVEETAFQCGFCTPGFIVSVTALLEGSPDPSDEEIREYLDGNLCRCTGYEQILDAVRLAAQLAKVEHADG